MNDTLLVPQWCMLTTGKTVSLAPHFAVGISKGKICYVGPLDAAPEQTWNTVVLADHILMPGLVNAHTHAAMTLLRGIADDVPLGTWLRDYIWPRETAHVSPAFVYDGTLIGAAEMLRGGITCVADGYPFPHDAMRAFKQAGMRAIFTAPIFDLPTAYASNADQYLQLAVDLKDALSSSTMYRMAFGAHAPYSVSDETFRKIVAYAGELNVPIHTHLDEAANEPLDSKAVYGKTATRRLGDLGILSPDFVAAHAIHVSNEDISELATTQSSVVHCPVSNLKLASGIAPISKMLAAGINVALGTDGAASNNRLDLWQEMRVAALLSKGHTRDAATLPAAQALYMATMGGAKALGWEQDIGSIEPGKCADLIAVSMSDTNMLPIYDPLSHLVYVCGREHVTHVWVDGRLCLEDRRLITIDEQDVRRRAHTWQGQLQ